jgi:undecaprenyl-diphosphatase
MYLGVHYPIDIMCGLVWGGTVGTAIWYLHYRIKKYMGKNLGFISSQYTVTGYQLSDVNIIITIMSLTIVYSIIKSCYMIYL